MKSLLNNLGPVEVFSIIENLLRNVKCNNHLDITYSVSPYSVPEFIVKSDNVAFRGGLCIRMDHLENDLAVLQKTVDATMEPQRPTPVFSKPASETRNDYDVDDLPF